jgi:hypothetical protein
MADVGARRRVSRAARATDRDAAVTALLARNQAWSEAGEPLQVPFVVVSASPSLATPATAGRPMANGPSDPSTSE